MLLPKSLPLKPCLIQHSLRLGSSSASVEFVGNELRESLAGQKEDHLVLRLDDVASDN